MAFVKWKNGTIQENIEVRTANQVSIGSYDHHQPTNESDAEIIAFLNACLKEYGNTDRIGPAPADSNDPARYYPIGTVVCSRTVDENGHVGWAFVTGI